MDLMSLILAQIYFVLLVIVPLETLASNKQERL
jgi:hypothetical protein